VIALDLPELALGPRIDLVLQGLGHVGATEMWMVTPKSVAEAVQSQLQGKPVRFLSLSQFLSLIEKLSVVGPALDEVAQAAGAVRQPARHVLAAQAEDQGLGGIVGDAGGGTPRALSR